MSTPIPLLSEINSATTYGVLFDLLEVFAFLLPAFPSSFKMRLLVLCIYWVGHHYKLQYEYLKIKKTYTSIRTE